MEVDWRLGRAPNIFAEFQEGAEFGRQVKADRDRSSAYDTAAKDPRAGRMALMKAGDYRGADAIGQDMDAEASQKAQAAKRQQEATMDLLKRVRMVPAGQRLAFLQQQAPRLASVGLDPGELADSTEEELSDQNLDAITGQVEEAYKQFFQTKGGIYGVSPRGEVSTLHEFPQEPISVREGETLLDPRTRQPIYSKPKTFAPKGGRGGGRGAAGLPPPPSGWSPVR